MSVPVAVESTLSAVANPPTARPKSVTEAAEQFEALLIRQMLQSARGEEPGWFGSAEDGGSNTAADLAEEQFAQALAHSGGLGLSARIAASLSSTGPQHGPSEAPAPRGVLRSGLGR